ncbi:MAG: hypothetical protein ACO3A2_06680, partial [Bdellovibrionia bacterium]
MSLKLIAEIFSDLFDDLRFVIGVFFGSVSLILLGAGIFSRVDPVTQTNLNLFSCALMGGFSVVMVSLSLRARSQRRQESAVEAS